MGRRGFRDGAIYFDHSGDCRDARLHQGCPGRWRGAVSLGYGPDGKRIRRKVSTKQDVKDKLGKLHSDLEAGVRGPVARYTVGQAVVDWLREGLDGRSEKTVTLYRQVLQPVVDRIGKVALRELTAQDVRRVLAEVAGRRSSRTVGMVHNSLERAIRHAEANHYVRRNVATLVKPPTGQTGRPSRALTLEQAVSLLAAAEASPLGAYVVLCLLTGVRTEEARALTWDHVDLDGNAKADPPSVRSGRCGSIRSSRPGNGGWPVTCGKTAASCSVRRSDRRSTRRTCAGLSGRSRKRRGSASGGLPES